MMILIHADVFQDLNLCVRKKWYMSIGVEMPRVFRLFSEDRKLPGESPFHYLKLQQLQNKTFHAGIVLRNENVGKRRGPRLVYVKEDVELVKVLYVGGHKDKRYNNSADLVKLIEQRYSDARYVEYDSNMSFE